MASSVDGLISGLSTSTLISQLMQVESAGQTKLKSRVATEQKNISAFQSVNTKIAALKTAATTMTEAATWATAKATTSSDAVSVAASSGATTGQFTFDVKRLAAANVQTAVLGADWTAPTSLSIKVGETTTAIDVTDGTKQGVANAINSANLGVSAALISTEQGDVLQLTATKTGAANAFQVTGLNAGLTEVTAGQDAQIAVGTVGQGGYTVTSASNTFSNLMPGVSITANKVESGITVSVTSDVDAMANKMQSMVDAANGVLSEIANQTKITTGSSGTTAGAALSGNSLVRQVRSDILSAVSGGLADYGSFSQLGVQTGKDGKLTFDKAAFVAKYQADPAATKTAVTEGLAKSFKALSESANTDVTSAVQSGNNKVRDLNKQVDNWDVRLRMRQEALQKQFTNLEVALGKLQDQSSWLAGQLAALG